MAYQNKYPYQLKRTKIKEGKEGGEFNYCYIEFKGNLLKIDVSEAVKDKKSDKDGDYWVKVSDLGKANAKTQQQNNFGGGNQSNKGGWRK